MKVTYIISLIEVLIYITSLYMSFVFQNYLILKIATMTICLINLIIVINDIK